MTSGADEFKVCSRTLAGLVKCNYSAVVSIPREESLLSSPGPTEYTGLLRTKREHTAESRIDPFIDSSVVFDHLGHALYRLSRFWRLRLWYASGVVCASAHVDRGSNSKYHMM